MDKKFQIEDFKNSSFPVIRANYKVFEVAKIMQNSMSHGQVFLPKSEIKFTDLELNSYPMQVFERIRMFCTPVLKETKLGKMLIWDDFALRIKNTVI